MTPLGAALLVQLLAVVEAPPPAGLLPTTSTPTDDLNLASPLPADLVSSSPSPAVDADLPLGSYRTRFHGSTRAPTSTRLTAVRTFNAWGANTPATPHPTVASPIRLYTLFRMPNRGKRQYRTADTSLQVTSTMATLTTLRGPTSTTIRPTTLSGPTTSTRPTTLGKPITISGPSSTTTRPTTLSGPTTSTRPTTLGKPITISGPSSTTTRPTTSLISLTRTNKAGTDDRGGRAVWPSVPAYTDASDEQSSTEYYRRYYTSPGVSAPTSNASWWTAVQDLPSLGHSLGFGNAIRRGGQHHHSQHRHKPFVTAHWNDPDYGDSAGGGSQVVALSQPHPYHQPHGHHQPVYYVADHQKKDDSWGDLTTKLIALAAIKLLIVKALGLGAFKLLIIGLIKIPIALGAFALKFAVVVKFFKFIKFFVLLFLAVLVIPIALIALLPLLLPILIPLGLLLIPLLLLPLLLLFPVPVLTPGGAGGGTVITITPGRRRREEEEQALAQLESRVADSRRCLQKMACDVGYRSQAVKGYADFVVWLVGLVKPILGEPKRVLLKNFISAYKAGLGGRSCYRKYPCYANNLNTKRGKGGKASDDDDNTLGREDDDVDVDDGGTSKNGTTVVVNGVGSAKLSNNTLTTLIDGDGDRSGSVEESIVYDLDDSSSKRDSKNNSIVSYG